MRKTETDLTFYSEIKYGIDEGREGREMMMKGNLSMHTAQMT